MHHRGREQLRRRPPPTAETGSRSRGSGRRGGPPEGRRTMRAPQTVQCPRESPRGMRRSAGPDGGSLTESVGLLFCCYSPGRRVGADGDSNSCGGDRRLRRKQGAEAGAAVAEAAARPRGAGRCGHRNPYSARRPLRRAKRLLRSYAGVCLQGLVIALACIIFSALSTSAPAVDAGSSAITAVWSYVGTLAFNLLVLVGAVKGCDRIVKEIMGL